MPGKIPRTFAPKSRQCGKGKNTYAPKIRLPKSAATSTKISLNFRSFPSRIFLRHFDCFRGAGEPASFPGGTARTFPPPFRFKARCTGASFPLPRNRREGAGVCIKTSRHARRKKKRREKNAPQNFKESRYPREHCPASHSPADIFGGE